MYVAVCWPHLICHLLPCRTYLQNHHLIQILAEISREHQEAVSRQHECLQVRVAMLSEVPTKLPLTLKAYVLSKDNLATLEQWHPAHHVVTEGVSGGEVQQTVLCNEGQGEQMAGGTRPDGGSMGLLGGVADFVFKGG